MRPKPFERICASCRKLIVKNNMIKFVKNNNIISADNSGHGQGKGAYLCKDCLKQNLKALNRAFKMQISKDNFDEIKKEVEEINFGESKQ